MDTERGRLESILATKVRSYLEAHTTGDEAAKDEGLRWICAVLERLVPYLLEDHRDWPRGSWIDGVSGILLKVSSPSEMTLECAASLVDSNGEYWEEPFFAAIRLGDEDDHLAYRLSLGDAARGLRQIACGRPIRRWPEKWIFTMNSEREVS